MGGHEQKFIQEAFDTNWVVPLGPNVDGFEDDLEKFLGEELHVVALSSGTAAIHLALIMLAKLWRDIRDAQLPKRFGVPDIAPEYVIFEGGFRDSPEWGKHFRYFTFHVLPILWR